MIKRFKLSHKLLIALLLVGILPMGVTAGLALWNASRALSGNAFAQLSALRSVKGQQVERYLGSSLSDGTYKDSVLAELWRRVVESGGAELVDFAPYAPNAGAPTAFAGVPLTIDGQFAGVMAVQISLARINRIMTEPSGLGKSGEIYLVGPDRLMRSDARTDLEHRSVPASFADPDNGGVDTSAVRSALAGRPWTAD